MNHTKVKQAVFCLFTILTLLRNNAYAQIENGVFYAVTSDNSKDTSWLFGTYHLINDSYLNDVPAVLQAFKKAKAAVVEVIIDSSELALANSKTLLQNKRLTNLLNTGFADSLDIELKKTVGQSIEQFQSLKPMAIVLTLSMINLIKDNKEILKKYTGQPLDAFFVSYNKSAGKPVIALETISQQMDLLFNYISDQDQAAILQRFFRNKEENEKISNDLLKIYFENNLERIYGIYQRSLDVFGDLDFLIRKRNNEWMKVIPFIVNTQSSFIAVGALHLAGSDGLVEQLRKAGYTVTAQKMKW
ncbi:MAG: TraB/GumN family protein [Bacteroidetes bacterium]|nr:TraB/GumN family protein [Bacteroidota bacterium]